jgi:hypothetical protein
MPQQDDVKQIRNLIDDWAAGLRAKDAKRVKRHSFLGVRAPVLWGALMAVLSLLRHWPSDRGNVPRRLGRILGIAADIAGRPCQPLKAVDLRVRIDDPREPAVRSAPRRVKENPNLLAGPRTIRW